MQTVLTHSPEEAAEFITAGGVVAFPTETVYGLGAKVFDAKAIAKIFEAKQRPTDNPLIAHIAGLEQIAELATEVTETAKRLMDTFFPGPLTIVMSKRSEVPTIATAGLDTIGIRMPGSDLAHRFLKACGTPVVAPSANLSGRPSPTTWRSVLEDLNGLIDCILQGESTEIGIESTVVDCTGVVPLILRSGSIGIEKLREVVPEIMSSHDDTPETPHSPGQKHRHYSPTAQVIQNSGNESIDGSRSAFIGLNRPAGHFELTQICSDIDEYAHSLYEFLRECDRRGVETIYCEPVAEEGIGVALMDRIRRASAK